MAHRPAFDRDDLWDRLGEDPDLVAEIVALFLDESLSMLDEVSSAVAAGDSRRLERAAHTFKGALLSVSANPAAELAHHLERLGRDCELGGAEACVARLAREIERLNAALAAPVD